MTSYHYKKNYNAFGGTAFNSWQIKISLYYAFQYTGQCEYIIVSQLMVDEKKEPCIFC